MHRHHTPRPHVYFYQKAWRMVAERRRHSDSQRCSRDAIPLELADDPWSASHRRVLQRARDEDLLSVWLMLQRDKSQIITLLLSDWEDMTASAVTSDAHSYFDSLHIGLDPSLVQRLAQTSVFSCFWVVCVCVCKREREGDRERASSSIDFWLGGWPVAVDTSVFSSFPDASCLRPYIMPPPLVWHVCLECRVWCLPGEHSPAESRQSHTL